MKAFLIGLGMLLAQQGITAQLVSEASFEKAGCNPEAACAKKSYAQVCIKNFDTKHHLTIRTSWGFGESTVSYLPLKSQMVYRLVTDVAGKEKAAFKASFIKSAESHEVVTLPLEIAWTEAPTADCKKLPNYQFILVKNAEEKMEFSLTKVEAKP